MFPAGRPHDVASLLKLFLRELPEPLLTRRFSKVRRRVVCLFVCLLVCWFVCVYVCVCFCMKGWLEYCQPWLLSDSSQMYSYVRTYIHFTFNQV